MISTWYYGEKYHVAKNLIYMSLNRESVFRVMTYLLLGSKPSPGLIISILETYLLNICRIYAKRCTRKKAAERAISIATVRLYDFPKVTRTPWHLKALGYTTFRKSWRQFGSTQCSRSAAFSSSEPLLHNAKSVSDFEGHSSWHFIRDKPGTTDDRRKHLAWCSTLI